MFKIHNSVPRNCLPSQAASLQKGDLATILDDANPNMSLREIIGLPNRVFYFTIHQKHEIALTWTFVM